MRLTKKKALEICLELWEWLAETGKEKDDWPGWKKYGEMMFNCPFYEYGWDRLGDNFCCNCPLAKKYGTCFKTHFGNWSSTITPKTRKKYASLFLEQLRNL